MTRAVVIKTMGDPEIAGAIVEGVTRNVIPLDSEELAAVKAECARLRAQRDIRVQADEKRFRAACRALDVKYHTRPHGRLYNALLLMWCVPWYAIYSMAEYLVEMNRR